MEYTNTRQTAVLTVSKTITGDFADLGKVFDFTVSGLYKGRLCRWTRSMTDGSAWTPAPGVAEEAEGTFTAAADGTITFRLRHKEQIALTLPTGIEVTVSEENGVYTAGYRLDGGSAAPGSSTEVIAIDGDHTVAFTNDLSSIPVTSFRTNDRPFALLTVCALLAGGALLLRRRRKKSFR